jgi:hypothetical protein
MTFWRTSGQTLQTVPGRSQRRVFAIADHSGSTRIMAFWGAFGSDVSPSGSVSPGETQGARNNFAGVAPTGGLPSAHFSKTEASRPSPFRFSLTGHVFARLVDKVMRTQICNSIIVISICEGKRETLRNRTTCPQTCALIQLLSLRIDG